MSGLPEGWAATRLGEVLDILSGYAFKSTEYSDAGHFLVRIGNVQDGFINNNNPKFVQISHKTKVFELNDGDILTSLTGNIGRVSRIDSSLLPAALNQRVAKLKLKMPEYDTGYVYKFLNSVPFRDHLSGKGQGAAQQNVSPKEIAKIEINLAPLPEQRRIVTKIDSLTGKSRRARDHLDHIPRLVEKYKQAILAAAFRGRLLGLKSEEGNHPHQRCWDLPRSWQWVSFSDVASISSNLKNPRELLELPHIAPDNIESGTGRLLPYRTIGEDGVISAKHRFYGGQVIYSKIRPYLRKAVLVDFDGACSADMYPLTPSPKLNSKYLLYWLISEPFAGFTFEHEGRSVLPKINQKGLSQIPLPLPPIVDQLEIVRRVESAFKWVDHLTDDSSRACKLIDRLDQAVLAKAFAGELVPQDSHDEPASVLLDRIKAERAVAPKAKRGRKKAA